VITNTNIDLIRPQFPDWLDDVAIRQPFLALVEGWAGRVGVLQRADNTYGSRSRR